MNQKTEDFTFIAAPYTPMDKHGNLVLDGVAPYVEHLIESGVSGVFVCGTTGESSSLLFEERKALLEEWIRCGGDRLRILCHVGSNCLKESKALASHAERCGAHGVATLSPYFFKPNDLSALVEFLAEVALSAPSLPFCFYHMPSMTGANFQIHQLLQAVQGRIPNFAGIKYTHNDLMDMQLCLSLQIEGLHFYHGFDEILLCGLTLGVKEAVGSTYNYMVGVYAELLKAFRAADLDTARRMQLYSVQLVQILNRYGGAVRAGKAIMGMIGVEVGPCRLPIHRFSAPELGKLREDLEAIQFFSVIEDKVSPLTFH